MKNLVNNFKIWSWDLGFIDPSTVLAETIIKFYNFVFIFIVAVVILVLSVILFEMYYFVYRNNDVGNKLITGGSFGKNFLNLFNLDNENKIFNNLTYFGSKKINSWYEKYGNTEFLNITDIIEYKRLELIWSLFPIAILLIIIGPSFSLLFSMDPIIDPAVTVKVIGHQWNWSYEYNNRLIDKRKEILMAEVNDSNIWERTQHVDTKFEFDSVMVSEEDLEKGSHRLLEVDNRVVVPVGMPIRFAVTAVDVLHSWAVPSLGIKIDATPGRLNQFIVEIKKPGVYYGQCSELCGPYHGFMPIVIQAVPFNEFREWAVSMNYNDNQGGPYPFLRWMELMRSLYNGSYIGFEKWVLDNMDTKPFRNEKEYEIWASKLKKIKEGPKAIFDNWIYYNLHHVVPWEALKPEEFIKMLKDIIGEQGMKEMYMLHLKYMNDMSLSDLEWIEYRQARNIERWWKLIKALKPPAYYTDPFLARKLRAYEDGAHLTLEFKKLYLELEEKRKDPKYIADQERIKRILKKSKKGEFLYQYI